MTDIVERLREATVDIETREPLFPGVFGHATVEDLNEAADEILQLRKLWAVCEAFIEKQNISCAETIYQTDRVIENAYEFIAEVCDVVGYKEYENET